MAFVVAFAALVPLAPAADSFQQPGLTVRITSPLGRSSSPTKVRIVAQIHKADGRSVAAVRFSVDGALLETVTNGPPYATEWSDENRSRNARFSSKPKTIRRLYQDAVVRRSRLPRPRRSGVLPGAAVYNRRGGSSGPTKSSSRGWRSQKLDMVERGDSGDSPCR
jgi:hypothetical protein